ncbi:hypothetical protein NQ318_010692, partial [Aromia moschata]
MTAQKACKLCFKESKGFQVIEENMREIVDVMSLKIDFSLNEDYVICEKCADSIYTFSEFKSACLYSENRMLPFIRTMNGLKVDIVEVVYLMENPGAATLSDSDDAICRLCLKRDHCVDLKRFQPEFCRRYSCQMYSRSYVLDIRSTRDPKICLSCQTSLLNYYQFVTECLAKQENIMECDDQEAIKSEELDIKTEEEEYDGVILPEDTEIKSFVDRSYKQETNHTSVNWDPNQNGNEINLEYPEDHKLIEDVAVTRYHCYHCPYVTKQKGLLSRHVLIHRKSLEIRTYDCSLCLYKAKRKNNLSKHMLIHKDASEITTYDCSFCSYKAKQKIHLTRHMLIHKDASELTTYDCNASEITTYDCSFCSYKTKRKRYLTKHMLIHKDASEITTYDCSICSYKTKRKRYLTKHMLIHKDASEITTYDCSFCSYKAKRKSHFCSYKAKRKSYLTKHMLIHKDASEITTYDCSFCSYNAKRKSYLTKHMLTHKDISACAVCPYKAKFKRNLTQHLLIHKDASKCAICPHKTEFKRNLTQHLLIHKDASKAILIHKYIFAVITYQCAICPYNGKFRRKTQHLLFHKDASDVTTYANWVLTRQNGISSGFTMMLP